MCKPQAKKKKKKNDDAIGAGNGETDLELLFDFSIIRSDKVCVVSSKNVTLC